MSEFNLRPMHEEDWDEVAELICIGTNHWYQTRGMSPIFEGGPKSALLFCEVYESLDPGCCILAVNRHSKRIAGSCFYHPRETHISLGIMNAHPNYFGAGIAKKLLRFVTDFADKRNQSLRLVSSALNLNSFSLYTRSGFVPRSAFQDMVLSVPETGLQVDFDAEELHRIRPARNEDIRAMVQLELEINHISREKDFRCFVENQMGIWHTSVLENQSGGLDGFLVSVQHPGSNMLGPGIARTDRQAAALIHTELNHNRGRTPLILVPAERAELVRILYSWGARNCEIHFAQTRGIWRPPGGVVMPTFMPETG